MIQNSAFICVCLSVSLYDNSLVNYFHKAFECLFQQQNYIMYRTISFSGKNEGNRKEKKHRSEYFQLSYDVLY